MEINEKFTSLKHQRVKRAGIVQYTILTEDEPREGFESFYKILLEPSTIILL